MNNQEKKQWLRSYQSVYRRIKIKREDIERLRSLETKITPTISDMPKGNNQSNKIELITEKIADIEDHISDEMKELDETRSEIEEAIREVPNEIYQEILERRYINGQHWELIAVEMNYDYRWILRLHGKALEMIKVPENKPLKATL